MEPTGVFDPKVKSILCTIELTLLLRLKLKSQAFAFYVEAKQLVCLYIIPHMLAISHLHKTSLRRHAANGKPQPPLCFESANRKPQPPFYHLPHHQLHEGMANAVQHHKNSALALFRVGFALSLLSIQKLFLHLW